MKKLALLTSGGDAPGMNACIRAIVRTCVFYGVQVVGVKFGYDGLINGNFEAMGVSSVADIIQRGGTILGSARSEEFRTEEGRLKAKKNLEDHGIDSLIVLGGDGSFRGAKELHNLGIKTIGIPCTIDNDMGYTDFTIGFYTAVETVVDAISKIRDTSSSHGRGNVIEVMGRSCGDLALYSGLAGGAESIIVPEKGLDLNAIINKVINGNKRGKLHHIIILAEGIGNPNELASEIQEATGVTMRVTILGHIQRGGNPAAFDRILASQLGSYAVKLIMDGKSGLAIGRRGNQVFNMDLIDAVEMSKQFQDELYEMSRELSI